MTDFATGMRLWADSRAMRARTIVPGLVTTTIAETSEQVADFQTGIADLVAGQPSLPDVTPDAPMMNLTSGGFFVLMPVMPGQEALGLVVDRASGLWRDTKIPGQADQVNGKRNKALADMVLTPFAYTAPVGAPTSWTGLVLGGPAGVGIEVGLDGTVTITGQAVDPLTPTVITMTPGGDITLEVGTGNSVNVGGTDALALGQKVIDAIDGMLAGGVPGVMDGGANLLATMTAAWNGFKSAILALVTKGS